MQHCSATARTPCTVTQTDAEQQHSKSSVTVYLAAPADNSDCMLHMHGLLSHVVLLTSRFI